jgi:hypothetical protein
MSSGTQSPPLEHCNPLGTYNREGGICVGVPDAEQRKRELLNVDFLVELAKCTLLGYFQGDGSESINFFTAAAHGIEAVRLLLLLYISSSYSCGIPIQAAIAARNSVRLANLRQKGREEGAQKF